MLGMRPVPQESLDKQMGYEMGTTWETQHGLVRIVREDGSRDTFPVSEITLVSESNGATFIGLRSGESVLAHGAPGLEDFLVGLMSHPAVTITPDGWKGEG